MIDQGHLDCNEPGVEHAPLQNVLTALKPFSEQWKSTWIVTFQSFLLQFVATNSVLGTRCISNEIMYPDKDWNTALLVCFICLQKLFGHQMSNFHITIQGLWSNSGKWKTYDDRPDPVVPDRVKVKRMYFILWLFHFLRLWVLTFFSPCAGRMYQGVFYFFSIPCKVCLWNSGIWWLQLLLKIFSVHSSPVFFCCLSGTASWHSLRLMQWHVGLGAGYGGCFFSLSNFLSGSKKKKAGNM